MSTDYPFITPPPPGAAALASSELRALTLVWHDRRDDLEASGALTDFRERLEREWAIETGLIERLYSWERGVTEVLISQGVDAAIIAHNTTLDRPDADRVAALITDQQSVIRGLYDLVTAEQPLTEHAIRSMHQVMTASQDATDAIDEAGNRHRIPLLRGAYKQRPNNPRRLDGTMHLYCPPEHVSAEMGNLIEWHRDAEATDLPPDVVAAWLHHRFTQIHPFQDGNGRIARALASLAFLKARLFPLVVRDLDRRAYIAALEAADAGDLAPLVDLFADRQRAAILAALDQRPPEERLPEQIFLAAIQQRELRDEQVERHRAACVMAMKVARATEHRFKELAGTTGRALRQLKAGYSMKATFESVDVATRKGVFSNPSEYLKKVTARARLIIHTSTRFTLTVIIRPRNAAVPGVMMVSAVTSVSTSKESRPIEIEPFQFNYHDDYSATEKRYQPWLEELTIRALQRWRERPGL